MRDPRFSRFARHQSNGQRAIIEIPNFFFRSANDERSRFNLVFIKRLAEAARQHGINLVHEHLARWQAEIVNLGNCIVGIPADA
jgi:hypothetical protein